MGQSKQAQIARTPCRPLISSHALKETQVKRLSILVCVTALGLALAACGGSTASKGGNSPPRIAFLAAGVDATYTPAQVAGLEQGSGGKVTVFNPQYDPGTQLSQCQDVITQQNYAAIVITPLNNSSAIPCAKAAYAAKIPLIVDGTAIGKDINSLQPQVQGVDFSMIWVPSTFSRYTWALIKSACTGKPKCQVVMERDYVGDPLFDTDVNYVEQESAGTNIKVVATYESNYDPAQTTSKLTDILVANPNVDVVTFVNDPTALAGAAVIDKLGRKGQVMAIGSGGTKTGVAAVASGELYATIANLPRTASKIEGQMVLKAIRDAKISPLGMDAFQLDGVGGAIAKSSIAKFTPEW